MNPRSLLVRRLLTLATATAIGAIGWTLLGDAETASADLHLVAPTGAAPSPAPSPLRAGEGVLATVDGVPLTRRQIERQVADELDALDTERQRLLDSALEATVRETLLDAEAERRGIDREALLAAEVETRLGEVPDDAIDAFLREHGASLRDEDQRLRARRALRFEALVRELKAGATIDLHPSASAAPIS
ncbi:MAG: hypothetical protein AAGC60_12195 [Acidobacteriota bacterium]